MGEGCQPFQSVVPVKHNTRVVSKQRAYFVHLIHISHFNNLEHLIVYVIRLRLREEHERTCGFSALFSSETLPRPLSTQPLSSRPPEQNICGD